MAQHRAHEAAHGHHEVTNTGVDNRKLGFWLFLSSEAIFFACLLIGYLVYHKVTNGGPGVEIFNVPLTSVSTFVLLMSSLAMVLAVFNAQQGQSKAAMWWIVGTLVLGAGFLCFQAYEFLHFMNAENFGLTTSPFSTSFYVLTGFHGTHVLVGLIWMLALLFHGRKGGLGKDKAGDVEIAGLYWHFVDVVWIVLFTVIYLLGNTK